MAEQGFVFHALAAKEAGAAIDWYARRSPAAAGAFLMELDHAVRSVSEAPQRWPIHEKDIRKYIFPRFPTSFITGLEKIKSKSWPWLIQSAGPTIGKTGKMLKPEPMAESINL